MGTMIQVRNVPESLHRRLKSRAALAGMSLSDYVLRSIERDLERPTRDEILARLAALAPVEPATGPARVIREERDRP